MNSVNDLDGQYPHSRIVDTPAPSQTRPSVEEIVARGITDKLRETHPTVKRWENWTPPEHELTTSAAKAGLEALRAADYTITPPSVAGERVDLYALAAAADLLEGVPDWSDEHSAIVTAIAELRASRASPLSPKQAADVERLTLLMEATRAQLLARTKVVPLPFEELHEWALERMDAAFGESNEQAKSFYAGVATAVDELSVRFTGKNADVANNNSLPASPLSPEQADALRAGTMRLVPVEATEEMIEAAYCAVESDDAWAISDQVDWLKSYRAALAAADAASPGPDGGWEKAYEDLLRLTSEIGDRRIASLHSLSAALAESRAEAKDQRIRADHAVTAMQTAERTCADVVRERDRLREALEGIATLTGSCDDETSPNAEAVLLTIIETACAALAPPSDPRPDSEGGDRG